MKTAILSICALFALGHTATAQGLSKQLGKQFAQSATIIDGSWKGTLDLGAASLTLVFNIDQAKKTVKMDVPEQGAEGVDMTVQCLTADSISMTCPSIGLSYSGRLFLGKIAGTFRQATFSAPLSLEKGTVEFNRPQEPKAPFSYQTEDVTFQNAAANVSLSATLTYPVGYKKGQKCPVVLMVTGSGPENRDEEIMHHKPFLVLADFLARHGVASLRYDDRGVGKSTGDFNVATTQDFADDAAAGIDWLRKAGQFSKVGLLGHSEGGLVGYMLGSRKQTDFIVSLAGPACRIDSLMMQQLNGIARAQGMQTDIVSSVDQARQALLSQADNAWMRSFLDLDGSVYAAKTTCPVFAASGENDLNVPVSINVPALKRSLPSNAKNVIKVYPGLNHTFQHSATGNPLEIGKIEETFSEEVMKDIADWIKSL